MKSIQPVALIQIGLSLWVGALFSLGALTAPVIFKSLESRTLAGTVFGRILERLNIFELVCFLVVGLGFVLVQKNKTTRLNKYWGLGFGLILILWSYYSWVLTPEMRQLKKNIVSFDAPIEKLEISSQEFLWRKQFDRLHKRYSAMMSLNMFLGIVLMGTVRPKKKAS